MDARAPAAAGRWPLIGSTLLLGAFSGLMTPFLPAYYRSLGLSGQQMGFLLAIPPAFVVLAPPLWGHLADRTGRSDRVLRGMAVGVTAGLTAIWAAGRFPEVALAVAFYAFFYSGLLPVLDSIILRRVSAVGGAFSRFRLFVSLGFVVCSALFGALMKAVDRRLMVAGMVVMSGLAAMSLTLGRGQAPCRAKRLSEGAVIFRHREMVILLIACALHWMACAPFHATLSIYILSLGLPTWVVGTTFSVSVLAEAALMLAYPRFARRFQPRHLLFAAFAVSALRWLGIAQANRVVDFVGLAVLHAFTFGVFFVAATEALARRVPDRLRASAQGMMFSVVFGVGGTVGYAVAGTAYDAVGGPTLFGIAAGIEAVAAVLVLQMRPGQWRRPTVRTEPQAPSAERGAQRPLRP
ncbi:MAG TPA: MFS transporter [Myxococcaceae bacterium]|nr:MFS transporter [Myxococcaceae bacterium]